MAGLEDFKTQDSSTLSDLQVEEKTTGINNKATLAHVASHGAALSAEGDPVTNYRAMVAEIEQTGNSRMLEKVQKDFKNREYERGRQAFVGLMADPSVDQATKEAAIKTFSEAFLGTDIRQMVSEEAMISGQSHVKNAETDFIENNLIASLQTINDQNRQLEAMVNRSKIAKDKGSMSKIVDFAELMIPFAENKQIAEITAKLHSGDPAEQAWAIGKSFLAMGQSKAEIIDFFKKMPPLEREKAARTIVDLVESNDSLILPDGNNIASLTLLKQALNLETYTTTQQWADNIFSVMNVLGLAGIAGKFARAGKGANEVKATLHAEDLGPQGSAGWDETFGPMPGGKGGGGNAAPIEGEFTDITPSKNKQVGGQKKITDQSGGRDVNEAVDKRTVVTDVSPTSVGENYKNSNIDKSRATFEAAMSDDEAARVLYGSTREDVALYNLGPQVGMSDGSVPPRTPRANLLHEMDTTPDPNVMDFVTQRSDTYLWKSEKEAMRSRVVRNFQDAVGTTTRSEMTTVRVFHDAKDDGVQIRAVYGPSNGGYADPSQAIDHVKFALRDYGIDDQNIVLLARRGNQYVPTTLAEISAMNKVRNAIIKKGGPPPQALHTVDYLVGVNFEYKFNPTDIGANFRPMTVKNNIFSRFEVLSGSGGRGSVTTHIFDKDSLFDPKLTSSFNEHVDKSGRLEHMLNNLGSRFAVPFSKLPKDRQRVILGMVKEANANGIEHTDIEMVAAGLSENEIQMMKDWRTYWDTQYHLENSDKAITLRSKGYKVLVDDAHGNRFFAKPMKKHELDGKGTRVYDPQTDSVVTLTPQEVEQLYAQEGTLAELLTPIDIDGTEIRRIKSTESANAVYLRELNDNDAVLSYRKGYYQVQYKEPIFIDEVLYNADGSEKSRKAVATAGGIKDANHVIDRLGMVEERDNVSFIPRHDKRGSATYKNSEFQVATSSGRTAQKFRGERLESSNSAVLDPSKENILDPVDALTRASRSIAERVMLRNAIETTRARFMTQYSDLLAKPGMWPQTSKEIRGNGDIRVSGKRLADARDLYEYINTLENGYVNSLDDSIKYMINKMADWTGNVGMDLGERALRDLGKRSTTGGIKSTTFNLLLASAPMRQALVQSHQTVQLIPMFPVYATTKLVPDTVNLWLAMTFGVDNLPENLFKMSMRSKEEFKQIVEDFKRTGIWENVDRHNFIRESLKPLANASVGAKALGVAKAPLNFMQKIGFDAGERTAQMTSWLAHRNAAVSAGKDMKSLEVQGEIQGAARAFTYSMNRAGEMPYNENHLGALMQYMQVPHKAVLQMLTNRHLSPWRRSVMAGWNLALYGTGITAVATMLTNIAPDNEKWVEWVNYGGITLAYNTLATAAYGDKVGMDYRSLSPIDFQHGMYNVIDTFVGDGALSVLANSPAGSMLFGNNPRILTLAKTTARYFNFKDDWQDGTSFSEVATEAAAMFSGYSHAFKTLYALEYQKKINSLGAVTDDNVNTFEGIMSIFGLPTTRESNKNLIYEKIYGQYKNSDSGLKADVKTWYKDLKRHLFVEGMDAKSIEHSLAVSNEALRVFYRMDQAESMKILSQEIAKDAAKGDVRMYELILKSSGMGKSVADIRAAAVLLEEPLRTRALDIINIMEKTRERKGEN